MQHTNLSPEILTLIKQCLQGSLSLEQFNNAREALELSDDFSKVLFDDLEELVEHTPGYPFSKQIDFVTLKKMDEYRVVLADKSLLETSSNLSVEQLLLMREKLVRSNKNTAEEFVKLILNDPHN